MPEVFYTAVVRHRRLPRIELAPEFVLLLVLPPIIYSSAVAMSWREFRFNLRPISLLAIGCVTFTMLAVAAPTHWLLGFAWPVGFTLGAIVSPPDPVAPLAIARRMQLPRRLAVILEGEGLANDATALILYRFAIAAVSVGTFSFGRAVGMFAAILAGEFLWGIGVGWVMLRLRHWVGDTRIEITLSILTPFVAYWPPERTPRRPGSGRPRWPSPASEASSRLRRRLRYRSRRTAASRFRSET